MMAFLSLQAGKPKAPTEKELEKEIVQTLSGVNVLEFNIKKLIKQISKKLLLVVTTTSLLMHA